MIGLDRTNKHIILAPLLNEEQEEVIPQRTLHYDTLVFSVGSQGNDFNIPGVSQYCFTLDNLAEANAFQREYLNKILNLNYSQKNQQEPLNIVIIGAGATGVELAAELHRSLAEVSLYGLNHPALHLAHITLIESSNRILSALPEEISSLVSNKLHSLNISVCTNERVTKITAEGIYTEKEEFIPADICVWAAGIKAPDFLKDISGLETDLVNRLVVKPTLQTTRDDAIFALGDCAHLIDVNTGVLVPARAQAAHQQAHFLAKNLKKNYLNKKDFKEFTYQDKGSIIALGYYGAYASLVSFNFKYYMSGKIALFTYRMLYFFHLAIIYGFWPALWFRMARAQLLKVRPRLKLHFNKF